MVNHLIKIEAKLSFILKKSLMRENERKSQWTDTAQVMRRAILVLVQIQPERRLYPKDI